ncbi:MAG: hypothetical protein RBU37_21060 [Myxococcota bacterium]|nr:hypothetical protein [Myxococcota bacterium]
MWLCSALRLISCLLLSVAPACESSPSPSPPQPLGFVAGPCPSWQQASKGFEQTGPSTWRLITPVVDQACGRYQVELQLALEGELLRYHQVLHLCNTCTSPARLRIALNAFGFSWVDAESNWNPTQVSDLSCGAHQCPQMLLTPRPIDEWVAPGRGGTLYPDVEQVLSPVSLSFCYYQTLQRSFPYGPIRLRLHVPRLLTGEQGRLQLADAQAAVGSREESEWASLLGREPTVDELQFLEFETEFPEALADFFASACRLTSVRPPPASMMGPPSLSWESSPRHLVYFFSYRSEYIEDDCAEYQISLVGGGLMGLTFDLWIRNRCEQPVRIRMVDAFQVPLTLGDVSGRELWKVNPWQCDDTESLEHRRYELDIHLDAAQTHEFSQPLPAFTCEDYLHSGLDWSSGTLRYKVYAPKLYRWPDARTAPAHRAVRIACAKAGLLDLEWNEEELQALTFDMTIPPGYLDWLEAVCAQTEP